MDEAQAVNKIEVNLPKEKIDFNNHTQAKEVEYWKKVVLDNKNEDERRQLTDLDRLARKDVVKEVKNVNEIICYLKNMYSPQSEERGTYTEEIQLIFKSRRPIHI